MSETDKPRKVLLVEDDDDHAALFRRALNSAQSITNVTVKRAANGQQAVDQLRVERFDLMVLDLNMPGMRGFEVLSHARANDATRRMPTVIWSTSSSSNDTALAYELAANSYLVKPSEWREFREKVLALSSYWLELNQPPGF